MLSYIGILSVSKVDVFIIVIETSLLLFEVNFLDKFYRL